MRRTLALAVVALLCAAPAATAAGGKDDSHTLLNRVKPKGILAHQLALQGIASFSGGNRLAGTPGYDASALYVSHRAARAGLEVSSQPFEYDLLALADWKPPILKIVAGAERHRFNPGIAGAIPATGGEFGTEFGSQSTDIVAPVWAVDLNLDPGPTPNSNTSGCELSDYEGMPEGAIALVQRGTCTFAQKFLTAEQSGAGGAVLFNEGNPGRTAPYEQWFSITGQQVPWFNAAYHVGERWRTASRTATPASARASGSTGDRGRTRPRTSSPRPAAAIPTG